MPGRSVSRNDDDSGDWDYRPGRQSGIRGRRGRRRDRLARRIAGWVSVALAAPGLRRVTVSLDSLDDAVFMALNDAGFPRPRARARGLLAENAEPVRRAARSRHRDHAAAGLLPRPARGEGGAQQEAREEVPARAAGGPGAPEDRACVARACVGPEPDDRVRPRAMARRVAPRSG